MLLSFGECLRRVMQQRRCSIAMLQQKMGIKSATSISRLLRDECSYEVSAKFFQQLKIANLLMLNADEIELLKQALEVKRLGASTYMAYQTMERMFTESDDGKQIIQVFEGAGIDSVSTQEWIDKLAQCTHIRAYAFNFCFPPLFRAFAVLLKHFSKDSFILTHYFDITPDPPRLVDPLVCLISVLCFDGYEGFYRAHGSGSMDGIPTLLSNKIQIWATKPDGSKVIYTLKMTGEKKLLACKCPDDGSMAYMLETELQSEDFKGYIPVRHNALRNNSHSDLISLYQRLLFMEKDRTQRILWQTLCVNFLPTRTLKDMALSAAMYNTSESLKFIEALTPLHTERHDNIYSKRKNMYVVLNREAMRRFAHDGYLQEHPAGLPPVPLRERAEILKTLIANGKDNVYFHVYMGSGNFPPDHLSYMSFAGLGLYVYDANTNFNLEHPFYETIISIDEMAKLFDSFFDDVILTKYADNEDDSIKFLVSLLDDLAEVID